MNGPDENEQHNSSHRHHSGHHRHHHHHRHKRTLGLSQQRRLGKLKYLLGAAVLVVAFGAVMITANLLDRADSGAVTGGEGPQEEAYGMSGGERIWADADTLMFEQGMFGFDHRMETFLFAGTDNTGNEDKEGTLEYNGAMADFLLLMVLDYTDNSYGFLQIDRNTITPVEIIDADGTYHGDQEMQICVSHWYGRSREESALNTVSAVSGLLGDLENIRGYYILNMDDVGVLNSAVGGVEVTIEDDLTATDPDMTKGTTLTLTDEQAERYFRARMGVGGGTNAERMSRQRAYMASFFDKVGDLTRQNASFYNQLWKDIHTVGATNMNGNAFSRIANMLLKGTNKGTFTLDGTSTEGYILGDGELHEEFYPSENAVYNAMKELYPLIPISDEDLEGYEAETGDEDVDLEDDTEGPEEIYEDDTEDLSGLYEDDTEKKIIFSEEPETYE